MWKIERTILFNEMSIFSEIIEYNFGTKRYSIFFKKNRKLHMKNDFWNWDVIDRKWWAGLFWTYFFRDKWQATKKDEKAVDNLDFYDGDKIEG